MKTVAIIQARMGSQRLPNKMMLYLNGYPVIEWVYRRVLKSKCIDDVIVAIPETKGNRVLYDYLSSLGANVYSGSENDLVNRFYSAAKKSNADHIVRVCADNPYICWQAIDDLLSVYRKRNCDYAYNHIPLGNKYPDGFGAEVFSMKILSEIDAKAGNKEQREHATKFIWDNKDEYSIVTLDPVEEILKRPDIRLDIDTIEDYEKLLSYDVGIDTKSTEIVKKVDERRVK
ncbi:MAG: NTP transferase domain-containing protein [Lentisphaeraceae bacterium]|nr:NTP transferase domain-containing protein [Lentisphaeraceae bacterium]